MRLVNFIVALSLALALAPFHLANAAYILPSSDTPPTIGEAIASGEMPLAPAFTGCGGQLVAVVDAAYEQQVVELVNIARQKNSLPPLKRVDLLDQAARYHAADMAQDGYFDHDSYDLVNNELQKVCSWIGRITSFYVPPGGPSYNTLAENIAGGQSDPAEAMNDWMNSSGHRANILSTRYWELGVGYYPGGPYWHYWVQDFGRRYGVYPLVINGEAASSASRAVTLYIYGEGVFTEMRLRNDNDTWGEWQPFQSSLNWELNCGAGAHTVSVELRSAMLTASSSDSIDLSQNDCTPTLGSLPNGLYFAYSIADQALLPQQIDLQLLNTNSSQPLSWTVSAQGDWFNVQPHSGTTPETLCVTLGGFDDQVPGVYTGTLTVTVTSLSGVAGTPKVIGLRLLVYPDAVQHILLPYLIR
jgi:uncharacterized protein YkwD